MTSLLGLDRLVINCLLQFGASKRFYQKGPTNPKVTLILPTAIISLVFPPH